jgi:hypothetical protein
MGGGGGVGEPIMAAPGWFMLKSRELASISKANSADNIASGAAVEP